MYEMKLIRIIGFFSALTSFILIIVGLIMYKSPSNDISYLGVSILPVSLILLYIWSKKTYNK